MNPMERWNLQHVPPLFPQFDLGRGRGWGRARRRAHCLKRESKGSILTPPTSRLLKKFLSNVGRTLYLQGGLDADAGAEPRVLPRPRGGRRR